LKRNRPSARRTDWRSPKRIAFAHQLVEPYGLFEFAACIAHLAEAPADRPHERGQPVWADRQKDDHQKKR